MKASELIKIIQDKCNGEDKEVEFQSYEWNDDLEDMSYHERYFEQVRKKNGKIIIQISR